MTDSTNSLLVPITMSCLQHKQPFQVSGCNIKCEVALSIKSVLVPTYTGLTSAAPGFGKLDNFLQSSDSYLATPFWVTESPRLKRLVGYVHPDFTLGGKELGSLYGVDILYVKWSDFDRRLPGFVVQYSPRGVSVFNVTSCDSSVEGFIWEVNCQVQCAPGFGPCDSAACTPAFVGPPWGTAAQRSCPEHGGEFLLTGCELPFRVTGGTIEPFTGAYGDKGFTGVRRVRRLSAKMKHKLRMRRKA